MNPQLIELAKGLARAHRLDPVLICAVIEQESGWEPWSIRYEPAFELRYVANQIVGETEKKARSISWGLMQLMGQSARELGFAGKMASLCDPTIGIEWGCRHFQGKLTVAKEDVRKALLYWNGGGNPDYPDQVMARLPKYA